MNFLKKKISKFLKKHYLLIMFLNNNIFTAEKEVQSYLKMFYYIYSKFIFLTVIISFNMQVRKKKKLIYKMNIEIKVHTLKSES